MTLLSVDAVTVRFGDVVAVDDVTLSAEAGRVTGVIGPNGAGKTTLFDVISGLRKPSSGRVRFADADITALGPHQRSHLGVARTFQRLEVFGSLTVRENVVVALESRRRPARLADELIERVGLTRFSERQADTVPTGAARLLELARALATDPQLLLLDEPSSGLDRNETDAFGELLCELTAEGRAVVLVEHDMDLVMGYCDRLHVLDLGGLLASGTPAEIRDDQRVREAYLG